MTAWRQRSFWLRCAALLLLLISLIMPPLPMARPIIDVVVVLDITGSMNVRDQRLDGATASRLAMEKRAARALLASLPCGSSLGAAILAEAQPFLLFEPAETCGNAAPLDRELAAIDWRMAWDGESHIAIGLDRAMRIAAELGADLVFMTDGQEVPPLWWTGAPDLAARRGTVRGVIAGVGGSVLSPIPKYDFSGRQIGTWKPGEVPTETAGMFRGREHLSALDEAHLQALARQSGLSYRRLQGPDDLLSALDAAAPPHRHPGLIELRYVPACVALLLLAGTWTRRTSKA